MSSRRVPKGPGRRPMTEKRRRFLELLAQGWTLRGARRELEIHRSTGQMWKNGTTVRRKDGTVKVVPPLEPLTVRVISPRFLSENERVKIADLASRGHGPTAIGQLLGRAPSTISRELRRNLHPAGYYRPFHAHAAAAARKRRTHPLKLVADPVLKAYVLGRLRERWSRSRSAGRCDSRIPTIRRGGSRRRRSIRRSTAPALGFCGSRHRPHCARGAIIVAVIPGRSEPGGGSRSRCCRSMTTSLNRQTGRWRATGNLNGDVNP